MEDLHLCLIGEHLDRRQDRVSEPIRPRRSKDGYVEFVPIIPSGHCTDQGRRGRRAKLHPVDRRAGSELHSIVIASQIVRKIDLEVAPDEHRHCYRITSPDFETEVLVVGRVQAGVERSTGDSNAGASWKGERNNAANGLAVGPEGHPVRDR